MKNSSTGSAEENLPEVIEESFPVSNNYISAYVAVPKEETPSPFLDNISEDEKERQKKLRQSNYIELAQIHSTDDGKFYFIHPDDQGFIPIENLAFIEMTKSTECAPNSNYPMVDFFGKETKDAIVTVNRIDENGQIIEDSVDILTYRNGELVEVQEGKIGNTRIIDLEGKKKNLEIDLALEHDIKQSRGSIEKNPKTYNTQLINVSALEVESEPLKKHAIKLANIPVPEKAVSKNLAELEQKSKPIIHSTTPIKQSSITFEKLLDSQDAKIIPDHKEIFAEANEALKKMNKALEDLPIAIQNSTVSPNNSFVTSSNVQPIAVVEETLEKSSDSQLNSPNDESVNLLQPAIVLFNRIRELFNYNESKDGGIGLPLILPKNESLTIEDVMEYGPPTSTPATPRQNIKGQQHPYS